MGRRYFTDYPAEDEIGIYDCVLNTNDDEDDEEVNTDRNRLSTDNEESFSSNNNQDIDAGDEKMSNGEGNTNIPSHNAESMGQSSVLFVTPYNGEDK